MGAKRLFDYCPETGMRVIFEDADDGGCMLHYEQDTAPIIELNKQKQLAGREYYAADPDMWKVASIPVIVQMKWLTEYGVDVMNPDHHKAVDRLLNSSDWRYLKTADIII